MKEYQDSFLFNETREIHLCFSCYTFTMPFFHHAQALMVFLELYTYKKYIYMTLKLWSYLIGQSSVQRFLIYNPTALGLVMALVCLWWSWETAVETKYFIPCWFCTFAHWQRNYQSRILMVGLFEQRIKNQGFHDGIVYWPNPICDAGPQNQSCQFVENWINQLFIDVWFVRIRQYLAEIQLFESRIWGCKEIEILRKSPLKLSKWSA